MRYPFLSRKSFGRAGRLSALMFTLAAFGHGCDGGTDGAPSANAGLGGEAAAAAGAEGGADHARAGAGQGGSDEPAGGAGASGAAVCGDERRDAGEACDDGNTRSGDGCDADCALEPTEGACGDGRREDGEACDDGNLEAGDGCDDECRAEECGNARVDAGEECDPPRAGSCTAHCSFVRENCGNGDVDTDADDSSRDEECDDDNDEAGDGCFECRFECGDRRIDASIGEACDKGLSPELCSDTCQWLPACGDGEVQSAVGEECDPSNGVTCVSCKIKTPEPPQGCEGGAGGAGGEAGGCSEGPATCVPHATASNLVQNGAFDTNSANWQAHSSFVSLTTVDDGDPAPKALDVAIGVGQVRAVSGAAQCIPVGPDRHYAIQARYRIPADAPAGVAASLTTVLYEGTRCDGAYVGSPSSGPVGSVRNAWTPYQHFVDTSVLSAPGRLLLRLDALRPGPVAGSHVIWDSVVLSDPASVCGNCAVDEGESCDDGNGVSGDGCSSACALERCGDGTRAPAEECDDANTVFGAADDMCTPSCRVADACDACARVGCDAEVSACLGLTGAVASGPRAGAPESVLCDELRSCVHETGCHLVSRKTGGVEGPFLENCYCGTAGEHCFDEPGLANGSCRAEVEAALGSTRPETIAGRLSGDDSEYPLFAALDGLLACERSACAPECSRPSRCGDGWRQDRNLSLEFFIDGQYVACRDDVTTTGRGCAFEECDDSNEAPGDGCDEHCLLEACGNYLLQSGEECDDGNRASGDGCSSACQSEFECGNGAVESIEQCDPPGGEHVCTQAEVSSNPSQCACDARCQRVVCGDGKVQRPLEACDPPNELTCGTDCQLLDQGPCERCISESPDLGPFNEEMCNVDAECVAIKQCMIESECYLPQPAGCYCGENTESCAEPDFVPDGPCRALIAAAVGPPGLENRVVLERMVQLENPAGPAFAVMDEATRQCLDQCFPNATQ